MVLLTQVPPTYDEFITSPDKWYEVDALARKYVLLKTQLKAQTNPGIKVGKYIETENRFISEYTPEGYCKINFGSATVTADDQLARICKNRYTIKITRLSK